MRVPLELAERIEAQAARDNVPVSDLLARVVGIFWDEYIKYRSR